MNSFDLKDSVKKGDLPYIQNGVAYFLVPHYEQGYVPLPWDLPRGLFERDAWLRYSLKAETMWSNAISVAISKMASVAWEIESQIPQRGKRLRELLLHADGGKGWVRFIGRHLRDFLMTNNGAFIEIERYGASYGSRIKALHHLDSRRCLRTGDPERPVVYRSLSGFEHELQYWQVITFSDLPDPSDEMLTTGYCAANRAWKTISKLSSIERYVWEKVTGRRPLTLNFVSGVNSRDIESAAQVAMEKADARNITHAMGALIVSVLGDKPVSVASIPLAGLPENFDPENERSIAYLHYALAIGLDPQDLQPISNQQLGAGSQSQVLHEKAKGQGLSAWRQDFAHQLSELVLDNKSNFHFTELDIQDEQLKAQARLTRVQTRAAQIGSGELTIEEARQLAADAGDLPQLFLEQDETEQVTLSDSDKPIELESEEKRTKEISARLESKLAEVLREKLVEQYAQVAGGVRKGAEIEQLMLDFTDEWAEVMRRYYPLLLEEGFGVGADELGMSLVFNLENEFVQEVLDELAHEIKAVAETTKEEVRRLVGKQAQEGWSIDKLADELEELGEIRSRERALTIARTESARAYSAGSMLSYEQSGVVKQVEWLVTRPCKICDSLAGQRVDLGKDFKSDRGWKGKHPPVHPNCKCAIAPVI
jgi:SPP1 gp7 family putative phage head morphogenesis protein